MATYSIGDLNRREILKMSAILGLASVASTRFAIAQTAVQRTPEQILGPLLSNEDFGSKCRSNEGTRSARAR